MAKKSTYKTKELKVLMDLIRSYYSDADLELVEKAYKFCCQYHEGQKRKSGEPYYIHPREVTITLAKLKMDIHSIVASLLHDVVEDTDVKLSEVEKLFGKTVKDLVDGVTKLSQYNFQSTEEAQAENFRKMLIAMAKDIRVIIIKLADRLHNMRTLEFLPKYKQENKARETLDIYAPIANRLGISWIKTELEDLSFKYLDPERYQMLVEKVQKQKTQKEKYIKEVIEILNDRLADFQISGEISGRLKNYYSVEKKMKARNLEFEQIYDLIAFRILVEDVSQCYEVLGIIHSFWKPVPGRFKDYIAMPKPNNYQSLHTTVIGPYGERVEIQIRTHEMHQTAEEGIAAHWLYKEGHMSSKDANKFTWLSSLLETHQDVTDPNEFLDSVKLDLFSGEVYIFTPNGEVKELPVGSTPIDFAYSIHTDIGNQCIGAKVNESIVPLKYVLKSGDTVEIITSKNQTPKKDWLRYAKTSRAKNKIRQYLKNIEHEDSKKLGKEIFEKELKKQDISYNALNKDGKITELANKFKYKNIEDLFVAIGFGKVTAKELIKEIKPQEDIKDEKPSFFEEILQKAKDSIRSGNKAVKVDGFNDMLIRFAKCCTPIPGEEIIGFITRGRGITVHRKNCPKVLEVDQERLIEVTWDKNKGSKTTTRIKIETTDTAGLLAKMTKVLAEQNVNVISADIRTTSEQRAVCLFDITISEIGQFKKVLSNLKKIEGVLNVERLGIESKN